MDSRTVCTAVAILLPLWALPASADLLDCVNETGYGFEDKGTQLNLNGSVTRPFPAAPDGFSCDPPIQDQIAIGSGGASILNYVIGFGVQVETGAIATSDDSGLTISALRVEQSWEFRVVPDDPQSTASVPILITSRHRFGTVETSGSGLGFGSNLHVARFLLRQFSLSGSLLVPPWDSEQFLMNEGITFEVEQAIDAPPNVPLFLIANVEHRSTASNGPSGADSGAASAGATVTFEITTEADASIVFEVQELLGLMPPSLDVVTVPEPTLALLQWAVLGALGLLRCSR